MYFVDGRMSIYSGVSTVSGSATRDGVRSILRSRRPAKDSTQSIINRSIAIVQSGDDSRLLGLNKKTEVQESQQNPSPSSE